MINLQNHFQLIWQSFLPQFSSKTIRLFHNTQIIIIHKQFSAYMDIYIAVILFISFSSILEQSILLPLYIFWKMAVISFCQFATLKLIFFICSCSKKMYAIILSLLRNLLFCTRSNELHPMFLLVPLYTRKPYSNIFYHFYLFGDGFMGCISKQLVARKQKYFSQKMYIQKLYDLYVFCIFLNEVKLSNAYHKYSSKSWYISIGLDWVYNLLIVLCRLYIYICLYILIIIFFLVFNY
jgi:hypothetical protein